MSRTLALCLGCFIAATPNLSHADVYQCTVNGQVIFRDLPCDHGAKPKKVEVYMPSSEEVAEAEFVHKKIKGEAEYIEAIRDIDANLQHKLMSIETEERDFKHDIDEAINEVRLHRIPRY